MIFFIKKQVSGWISPHSTDLKTSLNDALRTYNVACEEMWISHRDTLSVPMTNPGLLISP